jgi:hypothetical protein
LRGKIGEFLLKVAGEHDHDDDPQAHIETGLLALTGEHPSW